MTEMSMIWIGHQLGFVGWHEYNGEAGWNVGPLNLRDDAERAWHSTLIDLYELGARVMLEYDRQVSVADR